MSEAEILSHLDENLNWKGESETSPTSPAAQPQERAAENKPEQTTKKGKLTAEERISQLNGKVKEADKKWKEEVDSRNAERLSAQMEISKLRKEVELMKKQNAEYYDKRLKEYGADDPVLRDKLALESKVELIEHEKVLAQDYNKGLQEARTQARQAQYNAEVSVRTNLFVEQADAVLQHYPGVSRVRLGEEWAKSNFSKDFDAIAKELDLANEQLYETRVLEKHKGRLNPPTPIGASGSKPVARKKMTDEEVLADMETKFGKDWLINTT